MRRLDGLGSMDGGYKDAPSFGTREMALGDGMVRRRKKVGGCRFGMDTGGEEYCAGFRACSGMWVGLW